MKKKYLYYFLGVLSMLIATASVIIIFLSQVTKIQLLVVVMLIISSVMTGLSFILRAYKVADQDPR